MIKRILAPIDGSDHAAKALEFACNLAEKFDAEIYLLHAADPPAEERYLAMGSSSESIEAARRVILGSAQHLVDDAVALVKSHKCKLMRADVVVGSATEEILRYAEKYQIDIIVIGSRGLSNISSMLMGSVSHKVGNLATCTCITVR